MSGLLIGGREVGGLTLASSLHLPHPQSIYGQSQPSVSRAQAIFDALPFMKIETSYLRINRQISNQSW